MLLQKMNSFVSIAKCIKAVSGNTLDGTRKQSVLAGLFVTFAMDGYVSRHGNNTSNMRYHITSVHGIKLRHSRVCVYGKIDLQLYCGYVFMCTAAGRRKWAAAVNIVQKKRWRILPERLCRCIFLRQNKNLF